MTAEELQALAETLREAGEKATEGPWSTERGESDDDWPIECPADYLCTSPDDGVRGGHSAADANLIVAMRNNLPTILSALNRAAAAEGEKAEPLDPAVTAERLSDIEGDVRKHHINQWDGRCYTCDREWPCGYVLAFDRLAEVDRLTKALGAERARVQRVEALRDEYRRRTDLPDLGRSETPWPQDREMARLALCVVVEQLSIVLAGDTEGVKA